MIHNKTKRIISSFIITLVAMFGFLYGVSHVYAACVSSNQNYCLLAPLPGLGNSVDTTKGVGDYLNTIIKVIIGFMAVLAVVMMVVGGIQYMVSNIAGEKASAKSRMTNAIFGLVLALSSYLILNTINPNLVNLKIGITSTSIQSFDNTTQGQDGNPNVGKPTPPGVKGNAVDLDKNTDNDYPDGLMLNSSNQPSLNLTTFNVDNLDWWGSGCHYTRCVFEWKLSGGGEDASKTNDSLIFGADMLQPVLNTSKNLQISQYIKNRLIAVFDKWRVLKVAALGKAPGIRSDDDNADVAYQIKYMSGYNASQSEGNNTYQSSHAFGISLDIEPSPLPGDLRRAFQDNGFAVGETTNKQTGVTYTHVTRLKDDGGMSGYSFDIKSFFHYDGQ